MHGKLRSDFPKACLCSSHCVPCFRYLAATLVINWLSSHEDPTLQRMAVAVISVLVAKVKTLLAHCACRRKIARHLLLPPAWGSPGLLHLCDASFSCLWSCVVRWSIKLVKARCVAVWKNGKNFQDALMYLLYFVAVCGGDRPARHRRLYHEGVFTLLEYLVSDWHALQLSTRYPWVYFQSSLHLT